MLMRGDYSLNSSHAHTDSFKEAMRQTMLDQEVIFRKQVHELHRIYVTQKTLMKHCHLRDLNEYQLRHAAGIQSMQGTYSDQPRREPHTNEKTQPTICLDDSAQSVPKSSIQEDREFSYRLQQTHSIPPSHSSNCMNYIDSDNSGKSNERKNRVRDDDAYCSDEVNLSLCIGRSSTNTVVSRQASTEKNTFASSRDIIDLEEPAEMLSGDDSNPVFSLTYGRSCSGHTENHVPVNSIQKLSDVMAKDPADSVTMPQTHKCSYIVSQDWNFSERGDDLFSNGKGITSKVATELDLNKIQVDESSTQSNNSFLGYTSVASSSGNANLGLRDLENNTGGSNLSEIVWKSEAECENIACSIDLESLSQSGIYHKLGNNSREMDIKFKFQGGNNKGIAQTEENGRKMVEDINVVRSYRSQITAVDTHCSNHSSSCKFDCISDDNPSITRTMHSGTDLESGISPSSIIRKSDSPQFAENACRLDWSSSDISKPKLQFCNKKKWESAEIDDLIEDAAASLISISLDTPTTSHAYRTKSRSTDMKENEMEQPECSTDSYESMVMKITETSADEYCVSSNPFNENEMSNKDSVIKVRRGRRTKDFQKDILPGMASLSRHEIREDINIMETVLRSREYKRLRSKTANVGNWFTPVKSRRSRLNYVGRKNYSW